MLLGDNIVKARATRNMTYWLAFELCQNTRELCYMQLIPRPRDLGLNSFPECLGILRLLRFDGGLGAFVVVLYVAVELRTLN